MQTPAWHVSDCVHALPSLQIVPFAATGFEHWPVAGLHVPAVWHWSCAAHVTGLPPVQTPAWHVSLCVHALPSLHAVPVSRAQVPSTAAPAATEQASHAPALQAALQQTPSAQKPLSHSAPPAQGLPLLRRGTNT